MSVQHLDSTSSPSQCLIRDLSYLCAWPESADCKATFAQAKKDIHFDIVTFLNSIVPPKAKGQDQKLVKQANSIVTMFAEKLTSLCHLRILQDVTAALTVALKTAENFAEIQPWKMPKPEWKRQFSYHFQKEYNLKEETPPTPVSVLAQDVEAVTVYVAQQIWDDSEFARAFIEKISAAFKKNCELEGCLWLYVKESGVIKGSWLRVRGLPMDLTYLQKWAQSDCKATVADVKKNINSDIAELLKTKLIIPETKEQNQKRIRQVEDMARSFRNQLTNLSYNRISEDVMEAFNFMMSVPEKFMQSPVITTNVKGEESFTHSFSKTRSCDRDLFQEEVKNFTKEVDIAVSLMLKQRWEDSHLASATAAKIQAIFQNNHRLEGTLELTVNNKGVVKGAELRLTGLLPFDARITGFHVTIT